MKHKAPCYCLCYKNQRGLLTIHEPKQQEVQSTLTWLIFFLPNPTYSSLLCLVSYRSVSYHLTVYTTVASDSGIMNTLIPSAFYYFSDICLQ